MSKTWSYYWAGDGRSESFDGNVAVSNRGKKVIASGSVRAACGDEYIDQIIYGASIMATLRLDFASATEKDKYAGKIDLSIQQGLFSLKAGGGYAQSSASERTKLSFRVKQFGGKAANLASVIPDNVINRIIRKTDLFIFFHMSFKESSPSSRHVNASTASLKDSLSSVVDAYFWLHSMMAPNC